MELKLEQFAMFVNTAYRTTFDNIDNSKILEFVNSDTRESVVKSNVNGWQSPEYTTTDNVEMHKLVFNLQIMLSKLYLEYGIEKPVELSNFWINKNKRYSYNAPHTHPHSYFSAVYYAKVPKDSGKIIFSRNDSIQSYIRMDAKKSLHHLEYYFEPTVGTVLIFPSHLLHRVEMNNSTDIDDERVSIAFNFR